MKNYANRRLRRKKLKHNYQYNAYKKDLCRYDICDYYTIETKNFDLYYKRRACRNNQLYIPDREQVYREYIHWYIRK